MGVISRIALALVIIGAINWGLIGFFRFDLVAAIFGGQTSAFARIVYALVGIGGLVTIPLLFLQDENERTSGSSDTSNKGRQARGYNYQTEFAEEDEIFIIEDDSVTKVTEKKGTNSKKKKK